VDVDEFEHTEVEQQARRDQQRVLTALARRNQQHVPGARTSSTSVSGHCSLRGGGFLRGNGRRDGWRHREPCRTGEEQRTPARPGGPERRQ
jgi:hypothetical protein